MGRAATRLGLAAMVGMSLVPSPARGAEPVAPETLDAIRAYVISTTEQLGVPGAAVAIVDDTGPILVEGYGQADATGRPVTAETPFRIASISKQLTGLAVRQLVDDGSLDLDAPVRTYLPWFGEAGGDAAEVTVRDLLAHTPGWRGRVDRPALADGASDDEALERNARRIALAELEVGRGTFEYSNSAYDVLGHLVQVASGTSFEAHLQERILDPLGMTHTHLAWDAAVEDGLAQGHLLAFGMVMPFEVPFSRASLPSASIVSSAGDLGRLATAHLADDGSTGVLPAGGFADLHRPLVEPEPATGYGWGWYSYPLYGAGARVELETGARFEAPIVVEHTGSLPTFASSMLLVPEHDYGIVVLLNLNDEVAPSPFYQLQHGIAHLLLGQEAPPLGSYDAPLVQAARHIVLLTVGLQLAGIVVAVGRIRRWRREPGRARGRTWTVRHVVLPAVVDVAVPVVLWWLFLDTAAGTIEDLPMLVAFTPDIGFGLVLITVLGFGWGVVRTVLTLRARGGPTERGPEARPAAA